LLKKRNRLIYFT